MCTTKHVRGTKIWKGLLLAAVLAVALVFAATAFASSSPVIDWWVFGASGSGLSSGGNVTLVATLGQPVTGASTGGNAWLGAGFWYADQPVQLFLPLLKR